MRQSHTLFRTIARFALERSAFAGLPEEAVAVAKEMMVNAAAAGLAGAAQQDGHTLTRYVQEMGGNGKCTIIGKGLRTSPVYAALANGAMIDLLDFNDEVVATGSRPGGVIFPVVIALGEMNGLPGQEVLAAFVLGCEILSRLRGCPGSETGTGPTEAGGECFWPGPYAGLAGVLGAATAAGYLLGLEPERLEQALYLAATVSVAPRQDSLAGPSRAYAQGRAAMDGLMAAMLVSQGLAAQPSEPAQPGAGDEPPPIGTDAALADFATALGNPYHIINPGVSLKLYPCASRAHTAIDSVLQLIQQYRIRVEDIAAVQVGVTPEALAALPYPTPANGWQARACLGYIVAAALTYGHPLIDNFSDSATQDSQVRQVMDRVAVEATEVGSPSMPYPASIAITLKDGRLLHHQAEFARGQAELPLLPEELDAKFLYCSRYILPPDHIEEAITCLRDLENIENTTGLFSVLGG